MEVIILAIFFGLGIAYFANQNTGSINIHLGSYVWPNVPIYLLVIVAFLIGLLLAWISSLIRSAFSTMTIYGKDNKIKSANRTIDEMNRKIRQLERDNAR